MNKVTAVIVSYKNEELTCHYVNDELSKCKVVSHVIIVVNAASEESVEKIHACIKGSEIADINNYNGAHIIILPNKENLGFAKANNLGACYAYKYWDAKYLLFSNDDIIINENNVIDELVKKINEDNRIGCIGPKILKKNGSIQGPGEYVSLWKRYVLYTLYPIAQKFAHSFVEKKQSNIDLRKKEGFVYVVIGCFFLVRTQDFMEIGMMDEHTFLYREEEILAEKWNKVGKRNYWLPSASVTHLVGQTTHKDKKRTYNLVNQFTRESDLYYYHNYMGYPSWQIKLAQGIQRIIGTIIK